LRGCGEDEAAFAHYAAANAARRAQLAYARERTAAEVDATIEAARRILPIGPEAGGCFAPDPIFVLGMPRAGSTLIEQILSSHPLVEGTMELPDIPAMVRRLKAGRDGRSLADILMHWGGRATRAGRGIPRPHTGAAAERAAVLHRQDAEQLALCAVHSRDPASGADHRCAA
jgi:hypothetical protein